MNVAINASMLDPQPTGVGVYTINIINEILKLADPGKYCFRIFSSDNRFIEPSGNTKIKQISKYVQHSEFRKLASIFRFVWNQAVYPMATKDMDLCYSPTSHGSIFLRNQIITIHDLLTFNFPGQNRLQYGYYRYFLGRIIRNSRAVITVSRATKQDIIKNFNFPEDKIHVIHEGYNGRIFNIKKTDRSYIRNKYKIEEYILSVGATYAHKNIERLILAYSLLPEDIRNKYKLIIAGIRENYMHTLQRIVRDQGLGRYVDFLGYVDVADLSHLYRSAAVLVYPSLYEGFGLPPLESMACGCPVIASDVSSLPEVCGDACLYVDPYDVNSITKSIARVLTNKELREDLRAKGLERAQLFSWEKTAKEVLDLFEALSIGPSPHRLQ
jgi:glycosyltransferase involved in cell wall biosynthesis